MNRIWSSVVGLGLLLGGWPLMADVPAPPGPDPIQPASLIPPLTPSPSPVAMFRRLLAMTGRERESYLTNRTADAQLAIRAKIQEYLAMDPDARELKLRATELRWQLIPLLSMAPAERGPRLALVPEDLAPLVNSRLADWDRLPPALQAEFLANDRTLHYFAQMVTTNQMTVADPATEAHHEEIANQFNQFFELTPEEKQKTLKTLSATERQQMEQTLRAFGQLPARERVACIRAFTQFAGLSAEERAEFLQNAGRWAQMSPQERQTWRDLVARVPAWPPIPDNLMPPPLPPTRMVKPHPTMATNQN